MEFRLDRELPIAVGTQLRGLIEFGISGGQLPPGEKLPSVREMALAVGVAPMTVAKVYDELKKKGLIEGRLGSGTFVVDTGKAMRGARPDAAELKRRIGAVIDEGLALGLRVSEVAEMFADVVAVREAEAPTKHLVIIGNFEPATTDYGAAIVDAVGPGVVVEALTFDALAADPSLLERAAAADLVLTFANRRLEASRLLPDRPVVAISLIPSEATRLSLASLDPRSRVLAVSQNGDFLAQLKSGVQRFAPHVEDVAVALQDAPDIDALLRSADVLIHATGADALSSRLRAGATSFEFRHTPDAADVRRVVRPFLTERKAM